MAHLEIRDTQDRSMLFRMDSVCTQLMRKHNSQFGHEYLHITIGMFVKYLRRKYFKKLDLNLCQSRDAQPEDREKAIRQTGIVFEDFLRFLFGTSHLIPLEILQIAQSISLTVADKFGQQSGDTFLCGYFFLRFLCPSLASVEATIHCGVSQNIQRYCILLSRILQASVNNQEFEAENMHFANEIIRASQHQIGEFFSCLRSGTFEGSEEATKASLEIQKDLKKYRRKYLQRCLTPQIVGSEDDFTKFFTKFFAENSFLIRKKIKFESGYSQKPLLVTNALSNLKVLQMAFTPTASTPSATPISLPYSSSSSPTPLSFLPASSPNVLSVSHNSHPKSPQLTLSPQRTQVTSLKSRESIPSLPSELCIAGTPKVMHRKESEVLMNRKVGKTQSEASVVTSSFEIKDGFE